MKYDVMKNEAFLRKVVAAIQKGVGADIRDYLTSTNKATNNAVWLMRNDNIITNIRDNMLSDVVELKYFHRYGWVGGLLIDRENKVTYTICSENTLRRLSQNQERNTPHYLQSILFVENASVAPRQMNVTAYFPETEQIQLFSEEVYHEDFKRIMDEEVTIEDGYTHFIISYIAKNNAVQSVFLRLLSKDFQISNEWSLTHFLQPDFSDLTVRAEKPLNQDAHNLVTVKANLISSERFEEASSPSISARVLEEKRQA